MERTSDFEQLLFLYKTEGKGISLEQFCILFKADKQQLDVFFTP